MKQRAWDGVISFPYSGRSLKPRTTGLTMVIDKGLGKNALKDLIHSSGDYIDLIKLTFGTSAFYERSRLEKKIGLITSNGIDVMPGGTFFEVAVWQDKLEAYFQRAKDLGFTAVEISDGTIELSPEKRGAAIRKAVASGLKVVTEVGKRIHGRSHPRRSCIGWSARMYRPERSRSSSRRGRRAAGSGFSTGRGKHVRRKSSRFLPASLIPTS